MYFIILKIFSSILKYHKLKVMFKEMENYFSLKNIVRHLRNLVIIPILFSLFFCEDNSIVRPEIKKPPNAYFTITPSGGDTSTIFQFDASSSTDYNENFTELKFSWDWQNDGNWDINNSKIYNPTKQYNSLGYYKVRLRVTDSDHFVDDTTIDLGVYLTGTVTDIDGNVYKTVKIGNQWWMAENLKVTHYRNGDPLVKVENDDEWSNTIDGAYCYYNNDSTNFNTYGCLYNGSAVFGSYIGYNLALHSWHIPSDDEWKELEMFLGMNQDEADKAGTRGTYEGAKMKTVDTKYWRSPNAGATNVVGFSALPGGIRHPASGDYRYRRQTGVWWTSSGSITNFGYRQISYNTSIIWRFYVSWDAGLSIRCVKDRN